MLTPGEKNKHLFLMSTQPGPRWSLFFSSFSLTQEQKYDPRFNLPPPTNGRLTDALRRKSSQSRRAVVVPVPVEGPIGRTGFETTTGASQLLVRLKNSPPSPTGSCTETIMKHDQGIEGPEGSKMKKKHFSFCVQNIDL